MAYWWGYDCPTRCKLSLWTAHLNGQKKSRIGLTIRDIGRVRSARLIQWVLFWRSITAKDFLTTVRSYLQEHEKASPMLLGVITCQRHDTVKDIILKLDSNKIQRIYVINNEGHLEGVITLRDIISRLVHEPRGYFGDFFDGVVPLPQNSRV